MNKLIVLGLALVVLSGCNSFKRATGQIDDTVLPGQRQEVLPSDQTTQRDPAVVGGAEIAAPSDVVSQTPIEGAEMPGMPKAKKVDLAAGCDPAVDLCPEPEAVPPAPPPTVTKKKVAAPLAPAKKAVAGTETIDGTEVIDGTAPVKATKLDPKKVVKKKPIAKKKPAAPAVPGVPAPPAPEAQ